MLRIVVRNGFGHDLADLLVADLERQLPRLQKQPVPMHEGSATSFHRFRELREAQGADKRPA